MEGVKIVKNKIISLLFICMTLFSLTACNSEKTNEGDKLKIVTTIFPQYDFVKHITGDNAEVILLLTPGSESHTYEPTAADISKIQQADLFIYNGGESEVWVKKVLDSYGNKDNSMRLMDYVTPIMEEDEDEYDEHIFTSLKNSKILLEEINRIICEIDSENSDIYNENTKNYANEISQLDDKFVNMVSTAKRKVVIFGDRFPFRYFANDYDLECYAAFSGCGSETEASPATISDLIKKVEDNDIPVIFHIEFSNESIAQKIADATNAKVLLLHSCHNISKEDLEQNISYVGLMEKNYDNLSEALN